jgi:hypothetical protein
MSSELARALRSALDGGTSLAELEATLLSGGGTTEEIDAAWLYAWAYDALRPPRDDLATLNLRHRPPSLRDPALGQPGDRHGRPSSPPRSRRHLRLARDCELDGPAASVAVPLAWSQPGVGWRSFNSNVVNVSVRLVLARVAAVVKSSAANSRQRATPPIHLNAKGDADCYGSSS